MGVRESGWREWAVRWRRHATDFYVGPKYIRRVLL